MKNHHHHSGHQIPDEKKTGDEMVHMDHSKMDHSSMHHDANPSMGMEGHDHHAMKCKNRNNSSLTETKLAGQRNDKKRYSSI